MSFLCQLTILITICFACATAIDNQPDPVKDNCLKTLSITVQEYEASANNKFVDAPQKIKCFFDCYGKAKGFHANGEISVDGVVKFLTPMKGNGQSEEDLKKLVGSCKEKATAGTDCDKAFTFIECLNATK